MVFLDGSRGEGGGQILRTGLALSLVTGQPFCIEHIRSGRKKPGLHPQHLAAVEAAVAVGRARVDGCSLGSRRLCFEPRSCRGGAYRFRVGTAGSCSLVLQTVLPALLTADAPSQLALEGGTHNPFAPPYDFLARVFLPLVERMGPRLAAHLHRPGFYPAGGGEFSVAVGPVARLAPFDLMERGAILHRSARAMVARLPRHIAERELKVVRDRLAWDASWCSVTDDRSSQGPGNVLSIEVASEHVTEVFSGFGQPGLSAEKVAEGTVRETLAYLRAGVPVGRYLADQLLLPMALAGGGRFRTLSPSRHMTTNAAIISKFLPIDVRIFERGDDDWEVAVMPYR